MPDDMDFVQDECARNTQQAIMATRRKVLAAAGSSSATRCEECGEPIPELRRRAMPGCSMCVECQRSAEGDFFYNR